MSALKGKKTARKGLPSCLLLSRESALLARGELLSSPGDLGIQIRITDGEVSAVEAAGIVQVVPTSQELQPQMGKLLVCRGDLVVLEPMRESGAALRENFRMPVDFESYVYPKGGGRAFIRALDLSCGGIAMYSAYPLSVGEICEVAIPITADGPLILNCEILRVMPFNGPIQRYAAKFVDLIHDQETALREAVFQAQMQDMQLKKNRSDQ